MIYLCYAFVSESSISSHFLQLKHANSVFTLVFLSFFLTEHYTHCSFLKKQNKTKQEKKKEGNLVTYLGSPSCFGSKFVSLNYLRLRLYGGRLINKHLVLQRRNRNKIFQIFAGFE